MSAVNPSVTTSAAASSASSSTPQKLETAVVRNWKPPVALAIFAVIGVILFVALGRDGITTFRLSTDTDVIQLPVILANVALVSTMAACRSAGSSTPPLGVSSRNQSIWAAISKG